MSDRERERINRPNYLKESNRLMFGGVLLHQQAGSLLA